MGNFMLFMGGLMAVLILAIAIAHETAPENSEQAIIERCLGRGGIAQTDRHGRLRYCAFQRAPEMK